MRAAWTAVKPGRARGVKKGWQADALSLGSSKGVQASPLPEAYSKLHEVGTWFKDD